MTGLIRSPRCWRAKTNTIEVAGIALLRGERCTGQIPAAKGLLLSLLRCSSPNGEMLIQLEGDGDGGKKGHVMLWIHVQQADGQRLVAGRGEPVP
ncbi:hypothetical protein ABEX25_26635 [Paenibacillus thiaminolyticus]|uniref:hypothetical protein n=1 Tax=Paenibacillus thiaminolyticus TaxID=49283 RepID=UPI003D269FF2